jgi:hypothetical protein
MAKVRNMTLVQTAPKNITFPQNTLKAKSTAPASSARESVQITIVSNIIVKGTEPGDGRRFQVTAANIRASTAPAKKAIEKGGKLNAINVQILKVILYYWKNLNIKWYYAQA